MVVLAAIGNHYFSKADGEDLEHTKVRWKGDTVEETEDIAAEFRNLCESASQALRRLADRHGTLIYEGCNLLQHLVMRRTKHGKGSGLYLVFESQRGIPNPTPFYYLTHDFGRSWIRIYEWLLKPPRQMSIYTLGPKTAGARVQNMSQGFAIVTCLNFVEIMPILIAEILLFWILSQDRKVLRTRPYFIAYKIHGLLNKVLGLYQADIDRLIQI